MKSSRRWAVDTDDSEKDKNACVWDVCFSPDGSQVVAAGSRLMVYSSADGSEIKRLKGHKDIVYCVSYAADGKKFASGSADKSVIIWNSELSAILRFNHVDAIQCVAFNPVTHTLLSCSVSDFGFWRVDIKTIDKIKVPSRICSCAWTSDGSFFALGHANGLISIRNKNGDERKRIERNPNSPIWSLDICSFKDESYNILAIADWSQRLSFYHLNGEPAGRERALGFDPGFLTWFPGGDYMLCGGSNGQVMLYSKEGIKLSLVADTTSWVWRARVSADGQMVAVASKDGTVSCYQVMSSVVHAIYRDRYMYRNNMTDVIVHHLVTNHKVKVKLRDLVKKVGLYRNRMAVQLPERIIVYELMTEDPKDMQYHVKEKINLKVECSLLVVTYSNILLCQEKKLISYTFKGVKEREWTMEAQIRYLKVIGGLPSREGLVVGLKNGQVWKVFIDNQFPILISSISGSVRCVDLSMTRRKLAIVDETEACSVYDVNTKELMFTELNVSSIAWNAQFEDMLCYSGHGLIGIKAANFPTNRQRFAGFVVGFMGSKVFCLFGNNSMIAIDIPQSLAMYQFLEKNRFNDAYRVACLGVTDGDWKFLAESALEHAKFDIAKKAFIRLREAKYLDLMYTIQERSERGESNVAVFLGDSLAYQGRFAEAAKSYRRSGKEHLAFRMYSDLKMFDQAKEYLSNDDQENRRQLLSKQADWARNVNDPRAAADMYMAAGEFHKAIDILGENGWTDKLIDLVRRLNKADTDSLSKCGEYLRNLGQYAFASECYNKMGDINGLVAVCIDSKNWDEAVDLARRYPDRKKDIYEPYAKALIEKSEFELAQQAFHEGGLAAAALQLLEQLTENAVAECRFDDAAFYYWKLSMQCAEVAQRNPAKRSEMFQKYITYQSFADMFYAYHPIYKYTEEPFSALTPQQIFFRSHFLFHALIRESPPGISKSLVLITMARFASQLGCFKLANFSYERLQHLYIPAKFRSQVQLQSLFIKSKHFKDKEELQPLCYRCSNHSPLLSNQANICSNCKNSFFYSFDTFEVLPVVSFELEPGISHDEAMTLIEAGQSANEEDDKRSKGREGKGRVIGESLVIGGQEDNVDDGDDLDLFTKNLMQSDFEEGDALDDNTIKTVVVGREILRSLSVADVIVIEQPDPLPTKYLKNMLPSLRIIKCQQCSRLFNLEDYEKITREIGQCPFCRRKSDK